MGRRIVVLGLVASLALMFGGCATAVKEVPVQKPLPVAAGAKVKTLALTKMVLKMPAGKRVGSEESGVLCLPRKTWDFPGGTLSFSDYMGQDVMNETFQALLKAAHYPVPEESENLFEVTAPVEPELQVGALVKDLEVSVCYPMRPYAGWRNVVTGKGYVEVEWQIYSNRARKVVYTVTTQGSFKIDKAQPGEGLDVGFTYAFAAAVNNLLADKGFHDLVIMEPGEEPEPQVADTIVIDGAKPYSGAISDNMTEVRGSVVTVMREGAHGSGFFIDGQLGLLLTNAHVVGAERLVKVKLATGRELLGEVLRVDPKRDVALVQVEEGKMMCLPLRDADLNVGEEVYAVGSPLSEALSTTLSRGIVSAFRTNKDGMELIQSDVNILPGNSGGPLLDAHGNVAGIAVSLLRDSGSYTGINFFIPIREALARLHIVGKGEEATTGQP